MVTSPMRLEAKGISCVRNGRQLFAGLDFSLNPSELVELRGPNGAGKSSLLRLLAGLVPKESGSIIIDGESEDDVSLPQMLHLIAHQDAMKPALSVAENLEFWCAMLGGTSITPALEAFQLSSLRNDPVQLLSAGQRRRLTLSRLFLAHRALWLLDEPATALDMASQDVLVGHMKKHLGDGGSILAAVHGELGLKPTRSLTIGPARVAA